MKRTLRAAVSCASPMQDALHCMVGALTSSGMLCYALTQTIYIYAWMCKESPVQDKWILKEMAGKRPNATYKSSQ